MSRRGITQHELSKLLDDELAWRRKELNLIKNYIPAEKNLKQDAALRFNIPLLYAHFEGFVKKSTEYYLQYVAGLYLKHSELQPQFISLSLSKKIGILEMKNIEEKTNAIQFILENFEQRSNILTKNVIQTKSNLRFNIFKEILFTICLDENQFSKYETLINDLVDTRNFIAHGDYIKVDLATFNIMFDDIQEIMTNLKTEIENSVLNHKYKKA